MSIIGQNSFLWTFPTIVLLLRQTIKILHSTPWQLSHDSIHCILSISRRYDNVMRWWWKIEHLQLCYFFHSTRCCCLCCIRVIHYMCSLLQNFPPYLQQSLYLPSTNNSFLFSYLISFMLCTQKFYFLLNSMHVKAYLTNTYALFLKKTLLTI